MPEGFPPVSYKLIIEFTIFKKGAILKAMIERQAASTLQLLARSFPVVAVTGPRQSGKTTLVRALFQDKPYVSLEDLDVRAFAQEDPKRFLGQYPDGAILDEVQRCPDLFSYLQTRVDADKRSGLFILTGSQQFGLLSGITQSLAGRVALLSLLPFSLSELQASHQAPASLDTLLFQGLYPPVYDRQVAPTYWYENYLRTYVERDVRQLINVRDLATFQRFVRLCAGHTGQLVNLSSLANDCGINHVTAKSWLSVLEASYLITLLQPHFRNFNKRLVKSPKLYFLDTGLAVRLLGIQTPEQLAAHPLRGALFETWVVSELLKARFNRGLSSNLYFWRDHTGNEVDVIVEQPDQLIPVEIKSGQTLSSDFFKALNRWRELSAQTEQPGLLVYGGSENQARAETQVIAWSALETLIQQIV
jgi:predicted AAA+ superfamily ATPase